MDWISDALEYNSEDPGILQIVRAISSPLGYHRIARLALECMNDTSDCILPVDEEFLSNDGRVGPEESRTLIRLRDLLRDIHDPATLERHEIFNKLEGAILPEWLNKSDYNYFWLLRDHDISDTLSRFVNIELTDRSMDITLTSIDWLSISSVLQEAVLATVKGRKRFVFDDPYTQSQEPVNSIQFVLPHGEAIEIENKEEALPEALPAIEDTVMTENCQPLDQTTPDSRSIKRKKRKSEPSDIPARSSKRVRARSDEQNIDSVDVSVDEAFFDQLNLFISKAAVKFDPVIPIFLDDEYSDRDQYIYDFRYLLQNWDDEQAEMFFRDERTAIDGNNAEDSSLSQLLDFASLGSSDHVKKAYKVDSELASQFVYVINSGNYSLQEARLCFVMAMLRSHRQESPNFNTKSGMKILESDVVVPTTELSLLYDSWPTNLVQNLEKNILQLEPILIGSARSAINSGNGDKIIFNLHLATAVLELTIDHYAELTKAVPSWEKSKKEKEIQAQAKEVYASRISTWRGLAGDLLSVYNGENRKELALLKLRYDWTYIHYQQSNSGIPGEIQKLYEKVGESLINMENPVDISYSNYTHIPRLSAESIKTQISKVEATAVFARIFDDSDEVSKEEKVRILESVLMPEEQQNTESEYEPILQFLRSATSEFKLRLWYRLLGIYDSVGQTVNSFDGFLRIFVAQIKELTDEAYESTVNESQRQALLIKTLHVCSDVGANMLKIIKEYDGNILSLISEQRLREGFQAITSLMRMLYVSILLNDAIMNNIIQAPSQLSWEKVVSQIQDLTIKGWCLFYYFFREILPDSDSHPDVLNDVLSIVHEVVGNRGFCGASNGELLELSLSEFVRMDWEESEADLLQCLHCRYGLGLGNEHFSPTDHHCTPQELNASVPLATTKFIMRSILRKKSLATSLQRIEVKNVLDQFYEVMGQPDKNEFPFSQNHAAIENYLSSPISMQTISDALKGRLFLSFVNANSPLAKAGRAGFYYVLGQSQFGQFKLRKKSSSSTAKDLEECVQLFHCDLLCNSNRFESWLMIAQVLDALAADELTWNADKLNNPEQKKIIATHQKRSILACTMAINVHLQDLQSQDKKIKDIHYSHFVSNLWGTYAKLLYNASRPPMSMAAFEDSTTKIYWKPSGMFTTSETRSVPETSITKLVNLMLNKAIEVAPNDWYNHYMKAKVLMNLKAQPELVMKNILGALEVAPDKITGHMEFFIEPHYKLIKILIAYVENGTLAPIDGIEYAKKSLFFEKGNKVPININSSSSGIDDESKSSEMKVQDKPGLDEFYASALATLYRIRNGDKKRWHHRPTYKISKILHDVYKKTTQAAEEMGSLFTLRNNHKNPIMIWKPDLERPGEHYKFVYEYVLYFTDLLREEKDSDSLMVLAKKIRKFQSGMINHHEAWEHLSSSAGAAIKQILGIDAKYTDIILTLVYDVYDSMAKKLNTAVESGKLVPKWLGWLNYAQEFRKLNNSLGSTAALDDMFVAIYLNIYFSSLDDLTDQKDSDTSPSTPKQVMSVANLVAPSTPVSTQWSGMSDSTSPGGPGGKVRVTRRDIITRAVALVRAIPSDTRASLTPKIAEIRGGKPPSGKSSGPNQGSMTANLLSYDSERNSSQPPSPRISAESREASSMPSALQITAKEDTSDEKAADEKAGDSESETDVDGGT